MTNLRGRIVRLADATDRRQVEAQAHRDRDPIAELNAELEAQRERMIQSGTLVDPADIPADLVARLKALTDGAAGPLPNGVNGASRAALEALGEVAQVIPVDGPRDSVQRPSEAQKVDA